MAVCALELSVVVVIIWKGNGQRFKMPQCTLGNGASVHWAVDVCWTCMAVSSPCCFCVTRFSFWFLLDLPDGCRCLLLAFLLSLTRSHFDPLTITHTSNATLCNPSVYQHQQAAPRRLWLNKTMWTLLLLFQNEHLRVPQSGAVRWPHLVGRLIVCNSCSTYMFTMLVLELSGRTFTI